MKMISKKWMYIFLIIAIILISLLVGFYYFTNDTTCDVVSQGDVPGRGMGRSWAQNFILLTLLIIVIIVIVLFSYFLTSKKVDKQLGDNLELISQIVKNSSDDNEPEAKETKNFCKTILLKFLNYNENKVMKKLIENNGTMLQSEISRMPGIGKVKAHRILNDMKIKGIISLEKYGKTNRITLSDDVKKLFLE